MRRIEMGIWSRPYATGHQRRPTPLCLYFMDLFPDRTKLRNLRPRTSQRDLSPSRMASLYSRIKPRNDHLLGSQKPDLFPDGTEVESQTSAMVTSIIRIRHQINPFTRRQDDFIGHPLATTRLYTRQGHRQRKYGPFTRQIIRINSNDHSLN